MGADAFIVYYRVRFTVESEDELEAIENRTDARLRSARQFRLRVYCGRPTDGERLFLFIGTKIGVFGVENQTEAALRDEHLRAIAEETRQKLQQAGFQGTPALHFQLEAQY